jgi:hypothetical protein
MRRESIAVVVTQLNGGSMEKDAHAAFAELRLDAILTNEGAARRRVFGHS